MHRDPTGKTVRPLVFPLEQPRIAFFSFGVVHSKSGKLHLLLFLCKILRRPLSAHVTKMIHTIITACTNLDMLIAAFQKIFCHKIAATFVVQSDIQDMVFLACIKLTICINRNDRFVDQLIDFSQLLLLKEMAITPSTSQPMTIWNILSVSFAKYSIR